MPLDPKTITWDAPAPAAAPIDKAGITWDGPRKKTHDEIAAETKADMERMADPRAGMSRTEKFMVGAGAATDKAIRGITGLFGKDNTQGAEDAKLYEKYHPGGWATAGELGADAAMSAIPVGVGGQVLTKAVPFLGAAAPIVGDVAANALYGAATAPENRGEAAAWSGGGALVGHAIPKAVDLGRKALGAATDYVVPGRRVAGQLEKHLGKEEFSRVGEAVKEGVGKPSILPQTTAAMSDSAAMGGLERGTRGRGLVDLSPHDAAVKAAEKTHLTKLTGAGDQAASLADEAAKVTQETTERLRKMPLGKERKGVVVGALESLKGTDEVIGSTKLQGAIKRAQDAINDPNSSTLVLAELKKNLPAGAEYNKIRDVLSEAANERSKYIAGMGEEAAGAIRTQADAAKAAKSLRGEYFNSAGGATKPITEMNINRSATRPGLSEDVVAGATEFSNALRRSELHKTSTAPSERTKSFLENVSPELKIAGKVSRAVGSHGLSVPVDVAKEVLDHISKKTFDEAVAKPETFLKLYDAKVARGAATAAWESKLAKALRPARQIGGYAGREIGKE